MKKALIAALLICAFVTPAASADEASHKEAALKLLEVTDAKNMMEQMLASIEGMMEQQFKAIGLPPEGQEASEAVQKEMMHWFSEFFSWEQMQGMYVDIYTEVFTEDEIKEMTLFYESPLGQKMLAKMPELMQLSMEKSQAAVLKKLPELQERLHKAMIELKEKYRDTELSGGMRGGAIK
jgi:hypothetical protein